MKWSIMLVLALAALLMSDAGAQDRPRVGMSRWILPGTDAENYLRYLQTLGAVRLFPWSARTFSSAELRMLEPDSANHPWATHPALRGRSRKYGGVEFGIAPAELYAWYNTAFPYGMNDGAVWVGRGLTASATLGAAAQWGPVTLTLAPVAFRAENRAFALEPVAGSASPFQDPLWPTNVDRPQRFGNGPYARLDAGNSSLRAEAPGVVMGVSNANEWWGPMSAFPLILGNNGPGFSHAFIGTSRPLNVYVGRVGARVLYGVLNESGFSPRTKGDPRRFAAGMVAAFEPRFMPGLEVGATRFFHVQWPDTGGLKRDYFTLLFESFLKARRGRAFVPPGGANTENQLASLFARWVLPRSGFEVYGEYGREDHNWDSRDLIVEPDHSAAYGLGARKAWGTKNELTAVRIETINFESSTLARYREEGAWYRHIFTTQGHTSRGQLLGTGIAVGSGSGTVMTLERFTEGGSMSASWSRFELADSPGTVDDVRTQHVLSIQKTIRRTQLIELHSAVDAVCEFNRTRGKDRMNLRLELGSVWRP